GSALLLACSEVAGPGGLEVVPLGGRPADQVLEGAGQVLGDPDNVIAQPARAFDREGWADDPEVPGLVVEVGSGRKDGGAGTQGESCGAAWELGPLAEELDLDPRATDVAVAQQADHAVGPQRSHEGGAGLRPQRHGLETQAVANSIEPLVQLRRVQALDDRGAREEPGQPSTGEVPVA